MRVPRSPGWAEGILDEPALMPIGKFKAAQVRIEDVSEIMVAALRRWRRKAETKLWDISSVRRERQR
jgi:predicted NAD/FAD-dependent oxidoreductase